MTEFNPEGVVVISAKLAASMAASFQDSIGDMDPTEQAMMKPLLEELQQVRVAPSQAALNNQVLEQVRLASDEISKVIPGVEQNEVKAGATGDTPATKLSEIAQTLDSVHSAAIEPAKATSRPLIAPTVDATASVTGRPSPAPTKKL